MAQDVPQPHSCVQHAFNVNTAQYGRKLDNAAINRFKQNAETHSFSDDPISRDFLLLKFFVPNLFATCVLQAV
jgi:hypothetical protein